MNPEVHTPDAAREASETEPPAWKASRLASELARAMAEDTDGRATVAIIYPAGFTKYPVMFCYSDEFAAMTKAAYAYRDAMRALVECKGKGIRSLRAAREDARSELEDVLLYGEVAS